MLKDNFTVSKMYIPSLVYLSFPKTDRGFLKEKYGIVFKIEVISVEDASTLQIHQIHSRIQILISFISFLCFKYSKMKLFNK